MITELREMLGLDELKLDYKVMIADFDGENFTFTIIESPTNDLYEKIQEKMHEYQESDDNDGAYINVSKEQDKICIFYDTGNVNDGLRAVHGLLYALNEIHGIESVVINEI